MALWMKKEDGTLVEVSGGGGGGTFDGEHVPTGDPTDPATLDIVDEGQLLFDGVENDGSDGGPHDHDEFALVEHDHDEFTHTHDDYLPLTGGTLTGDLEVHSENRSVRIFDSGENNYAEIGFTTSGVTIPANGRLTGNAVVIRTGGSRETMQDAFIAYADGNVKACGDLQVDGALYLSGNWSGGLVYNTSTSNREFMIIGDASSGGQIQIYGNNDSNRPGKVSITGDLLVNGIGVSRFGIAEGIDTQDVLERAEVATMPAPADDDGVVTADVESLTVNEVMTAMLAKIKELSAEIEELKGN